MKTSDFEYDLPRELIAQTPIEPRDNSRLMVVNRRDGSIEHRRFHDLPDYLGSGDLMVFNDSRVFPARLHGTARSGGGKVELLLLNTLPDGEWRALVKPGRRMRVGAEFEVKAGGDTSGGVVTKVNDDGTRLVGLPDGLRLEEAGVVPLPPYIHEPLSDAERYQTVYARVSGSVAAPTAGLHFTPELLARLEHMGVEPVFVTLHVGWDSFRPVNAENIEAHAMHSEYFELSEAAATAINRAKREGRRVISVGTTAVRLLEQAAALQARQDGGDGVLSAGAGWADLFITPGYEFRVVDALVTNFHLPRSTLLMLTSAFAGRELMLEAYAKAADLRYRFYSFGDAMVVL